MRTVLCIIVFFRVAGSPMKYLLLLVTLALSACSHSPVPAPDNRVANLGTIVDLHTGATLAPQQLLVRLAAAQRVIVGEKHDNPAHHRIEHWLVENLPRQRPQGSVLMEMLVPGQQAPVDAVKRALQAGEVLSSEQVKQRIAWQAGWDWALYGGVVMAAIQAPYPLLSANLSRDEIMAFYRHPQFPSGPRSTQPAVQQALADLIRQAHGGKIDAPRLNAMLAIQQQRDRRMAQRLLAAPAPALLIAGGYHAARDLGVPLHMQDLQPASMPLVLMLAEGDSQVDVRRADYLWRTPAR